VSSQISDGNEILHQAEQSAFNPVEVVIDHTPSDIKEACIESPSIHASYVQPTIGSIHKTINLTQEGVEPISIKAIADIRQSPQAPRICDLPASETSKSLVWLLQNLDEMGVVEANATKAAGEIKQRAVVTEGPSQGPSSAAAAFASPPRPTASNSNLDHEHREFTEVPRWPNVAALRLFEQTTFDLLCRICKGLLSTELYCCSICADGTFNLCRACFSNGASCNTATHPLRKLRIRKDNVSSLFVLAELYVPGDDRLDVQEEILDWASPFLHREGFQGEQVCCLKHQALEILLRRQHARLTLASETVRQSHPNGAAETS
jgi:hypothetical protein